MWLLPSRLGPPWAYELIRSKAWFGPTLFLCPAVHRILCRNGMDPKIEFPRQLPLIIVHGEKDTTIPLENTKDLISHADPSSTRTQDGE